MSPAVYSLGLCERKDLEKHQEVGIMVYTERFEEMLEYWMILNHNLLKVEW